MGSPGTTVPPIVEYVVVLFDRETGSIAAFLDGNVITGLRTAATSALAPPRGLHCSLGLAPLVGSDVIAASATVRRG
jgi:alanine dehydrogenase